MFSKQDILEEFVDSADIGIREHYDTLTAFMPRSRSQQSIDSTRIASRNWKLRNRPPKRVKYDGKTLKQVCAEHGVNYQTVHWRMHYRGMPLEQALCVA